MTYEELRERVAEIIYGHPMDHLMPSTRQPHLEDADAAIRAVIEELAQEAIKLAEQGFALQVMRQDVGKFPDVDDLPLWCNVEDPYYSFSCGGIAAHWLRSHLPTPPGDSLPSPEAGPS